MRLIARVSFVLASLTTSVFATDYYVNVNAGSDAAAGTSPATAWKTLKHASSAAAVGSAHTIHVAPGVYSVATGEFFPLEFHSQALVSDAGAASTIIDAGGASALISMTNYSATPIPSGLSVMRGLTLQNAMVGVYIYYSHLTLSSRLEDVVLKDCWHRGVFATCGTFIGNGSSFHLQFARVLVTNCGTGAHLDASAGMCKVDAVDSQFLNCSTNAVVLSCASSLDAHFERCRFVGNHVRGVWGAPANNGILTASFEDCLFARNSTGYSTLTSNGQNASATLDFARCTFADNVTMGLEANDGGGPGVVNTSLDGVLSWGNGVDLSATTILSNVFSHVGGADPLFRDRVLGDYRVLFGSPVVDAGNPATAVGELDVDGVPRSIDGDLDIVEREDIGAFEFQPLEVVTTAHLGTPLRIDTWGAAGSTTAMYFSRVAPVAPTNTPFGQVDMPTGQIVFLLNMSAGPNPPGSFTRTIPPNPLLIGRTFSFQGRTTSAVAPFGASWTNVQAVTFAP